MSPFFWTGPIFKKDEEKTSMLEWKDCPTISVIIPCFNGEKRLPKCLDSIKSQSYPQEKIEYIIADDDSTDDTVRLAVEKYGCKVVRNGTHSIERGKSIGLENATGDYIFLIDDDNRLPNKEWLITLVSGVVENNCVGGQASYFHYDRRDTVANRYAALFAINDPTVLYLNKRDKLMPIEKSWLLPGKVIKENDDYWVVRFNASDLLTVGSQGFLVKRSVMLKASWKPYLYHMDTNMELVMQGYNTYIMLKDTIIHDHSKCISHFIAKLKRNIRLFYSESQYRKYKYDISKGKMVKLGFVMGTFIIPFFSSIRGFLKLHDPAWFVHPWICFRVAVIYTVSTLKTMFRK